MLKRKTRKKKKEIKKEIQEKYKRKYWDKRKTGKRENGEGGGGSHLVESLNYGSNIGSFCFLVFLIPGLPEAFRRKNL
jgi:hypothetical protein